MVLTELMAVLESLVWPEQLVPPDKLDLQEHKDKLEISANLRHSMDPVDRLVLPVLPVKRELMVAKENPVAHIPDPKVHPVMKADLASQERKDHQDHQAHLDPKDHKEIVSTVLHQELHQVIKFQYDAQNQSTLYKMLLTIYLFNFIC
jgi:hypothetical protein